MKFTQQYSIKWHDTDANRQVRPSALVTYLQETANEHLVHIGISLDALRDSHGLAFILGSISVCSYEPLFAGDKIDVETWTCGERGFRHGRCFRVLREGKTVAEATSLWALIKLADGSLVKVEDMPYHIEPEEAITLPGVPARLKMPPIAEMQELGTRRIVYSDIDYNGHMNNTRYPDMLCDFIPEMRDSRACAIMISYRKEAAFGHTLRVFGTKTEQGYLICTVDEEGSACTEALVKLCAASNPN